MIEAMLVTGAILAIAGAILAIVGATALTQEEKGKKR